jgi:hypothetical protein
VHTRGLPSYRHPDQRKGAVVLGAVKDMPHRVASSSATHHKHADRGRNRHVPFSDLPFRQRLDITGG